MKKKEKKIIIILIFLLIVMSLIIEINFVDSLELNETNITLESSDDYIIRWVDLPDAEVYGGGEEGANNFYKMAEWIVNYTPDFVMQNGDLTNGFKGEYERLVPAFRLLENNSISYFITKGNAGADIPLWNSYFLNTTNTTGFFNNNSLGVIVLDMDYSCNDYYCLEDVERIKNFTKENNETEFILLLHWYDAPSIVNTFNDIENIRFVYSGHLMGQIVRNEYNKYWFQFGDCDDTDVLNNHDGLLHYVEYDLNNNTLTSTGYSPITNQTYMKFIINLSSNEIEWIKQIPIIKNPPVSNNNNNNGGGGGGSYVRKEEPEEEIIEVDIDAIEKEMLLKKFEEEKSQQNKSQQESVDGLNDKHLPFSSPADNFFIRFLNWLMFWIKE